VDEPGQYAQRCCLLTRTGGPAPPTAASQPCSVDMDSPGIVVRPIEDDARRTRVLPVFFRRGGRSHSTAPSARKGHGWSVAMDLLPFERSTALWTKAAYLRRRLHDLVEVVPADTLDPATLGAAVQLLARLPGASRATQYRLAAGERLGPETSIDKVLVASAEQAVFDLVQAGLAPEVLLGDESHRSAVA